MSKLYPSDISVTKYAKIEPMLSNFKKKNKIQSIVDLYCVFCGVLYVLKTGCP